MSRELDAYPKTNPEGAGEIDGAIGDGSLFDSTYGYYAHRVGPETPVAPAGGEDRLVRIETPGHKRGSTVVAWCMEIHDLVLSKLAAGRPHDLVFSLEAIRTELVDREQLRLGLELMPETHREIAAERLNGLSARMDGAS